MESQVVDRFAGCTPREVEVMQALVTTKGTNREIAELLGIKPQTVNVHIRIIMLRTDLHSRVQLALAWAARVTA